MIEDLLPVFAMSNKIRQGARKRHLFCTTVPEHYNIPY